MTTRRAPYRPVELSGRLDAPLLAAILRTRIARPWTRDKRLGAVAEPICLAFHSLWRFQVVNFRQNGAISIGTQEAGPDARHGSRARLVGAQVPLPDDAALAAVFARPTDGPPQCVSGLEPWRDSIIAWRDQGLQGTTIHAAPGRRHGYTGRYASVHRLVRQLPGTAAPAVPLRPSFKPGEAA